MTVRTDMWDLASELGLSVVEHHGTHRSGYHPGERCIRLRPGMRGRVLRSVMAHEIAHHVLGHHPTDALILRARQEAAAQRWAAHRLIRTEEYVATERERDGHVPSMAVDLQVADELVTAYQRDVVRLGDTVYVRPGLGVGDWLYREEVA